MQLLLEILIAFIIIVSVMTKEKVIDVNDSKPSAFSWYATTYISSMLLFSIPSIGINYLSFQSMRGQLYLMYEIDKTPSLSLAKVQSLFANANTKIPNLTSSADLAIDAVISRYYIKEKKYDSALILLDNSKMANPYLYYNEFLKGLIYIKTNQLDSANKYCKLSFYNRPRDQAYFTNMMVTAFNRKDTLELNKAFNTYIKFRNECYPYKIYLNTIIDLTSNNDQWLISIADSAIKKFPKDTANLKDIISYRTILVNRINRSSAKANTSNVIVNNDLQLVAQTEALAIVAFNKKDYINASNLFIKASKLDPGNYIFNENAGLCFFNHKEYKKAITYFDKAINSGNAITGKSELFKGLALIVLGNKTGGCELLHKAKEKNYAGTDAYIKTNCN
jgi:tetratricopeptide (TPR) repeat protein